MQQLRKCLGVDMGASSVKIAEVVYEKSAVRVTKLLSRDLGLPPGPMDATRIEAMSQTVKDLVKENKITTKQAVFSLPGQSVFIRQIPVPRTSEERMKRIVAYEAKQQIPFSLDTAHMEYQIFDFGNPAEVKVLLAAVKAEAVKEFMAIVEKTGLKPVMVSVSSLAVFNFHVFDDTPLPALLDEIAPVVRGRRKSKAAPEAVIPGVDDVPAEEPKKKGFSFSMPKFNLPFGAKKEAAAAAAVAEPEGEPEAVEDDMLGGDDLFEDEIGFEEVRAFVNVGASMFDLVIGRFGKHSMLGFPRSVPWGSGELTRTLQEKFSLGSPDDAERLKVDRSMLVVPGHENEIEEAGADPDASEFASSWADRLILDLRKSFDYYISQPDGMAVDNIILTGGAAQMKNLASYIEDKLGIPVTVKQSATNTALSLPAIDDAAGIMPFVSALGLGLTGVGLGRTRIDFLPPDMKTIREFKKKNIEMFLLLGAIATMIGVGSQVGKAAIDQRQDWLQREETTIMQARTVQAQVETAKQDRQKVSDRITGITEAVGDRMFWLEFMGVLQALKPNEIVIIRIAMLADGRVEILGETQVLGAISAFQQNLEQEETWIAGKPELNPPRPQYSQFVQGQVFGFRMTLKARGKETRLSQARETLLPGLTAPTATPQTQQMPTMMMPGPAGPPGENMFGI